MGFCGSSIVAISGSTISLAPSFAAPRISGSRAAMLGAISRSAQFCTQATRKDSLTGASLDENVGLERRAIIAAVPRIGRIFSSATLGVHVLPGSGVFLPKMQFGPRHTAGCHLTLMVLDARSRI